MPEAPVLEIADRIKESTTTFGIGPVALTGSVPGYGTFSDAFSNGALVYYAIDAGAEFETGLGTFVAPGTLQRTTIYTKKESGVYEENPATPLDISTGAFVQASYVAHAWQYELDHINNTANPHGTTAAQVGAYSTAQSDAALGDLSGVTDPAQALLNLQVTADASELSQLSGILIDQSVNKAGSPEFAGLDVSGVLSVTPDGMGNAGDFIVNFGQFSVDGGTGNVGVGISVPESRFHVYSGAGGVSQRIETGAINSNVFFQMKLNDQQWNLIAYNGDGTGNFRLNDATAGTNPLQVDKGAPNNSIHVNSSGFVGIGTAIPSALLELESSAAPTIRFDNTDTGKFWDIRHGAAGFLAFKELAAAGGTEIWMGDDATLGVWAATTANLDMNNSGNAATIIKMDADRAAANNGIGLIDGYWNGTLVAEVGIMSGEDITNKDDGEIRFRTAQGGVMLEAMRITQEGFVGIGTPIPTADLHVFRSGSALSQLLECDTDNSISIIGDANRSAADNQLLTLKGNWNGTQVAQVSFRSGDDTVNKDDGDIVFQTAEAGVLAESMRITQKGFVGIGTPIPEADLHVAGAGVIFERIESTDNDAIQLQFKSSSTNRRIIALDADANNESQIVFLDREIKFAGTTDSLDLFMTANENGVTAEAITLTPIATPATGEGRLYYDSVSKKLRFYNGTAWETVTSA